MKKRRRSTSTREPVQRVDVDFPLDLLRAIDTECTRLGIPRQAFIKIRLADSFEVLHIRRTE